MSGFLSVKRCPASPHQRIQNIGGEQEGNSRMPLQAYREGPNHAAQAGSCRRRFHHTSPIDCSSFSHNCIKEAPPPQFWGQIRRAGDGGLPLQFFSCSPIIGGQGVVPKSSPPHTPPPKNRPMPLPRTAKCLCPCNSKRVVAQDAVWLGDLVGEPNICAYSSDEIGFTAT